ncbi:hypothetical protein [Candidatus Fukatsuia endosymbiont of Tuberolachnus salignus]|uniref:hypothetical protein n=1 Tax=Candidatus Fukatsuia endosymbiont of Tuberolachnus salignus TaxID=3077957 RepID=UPI00313E9372
MPKNICHSHQTAHTKMVKQTLKEVAKALAMPYQKTHQAFTGGDNLFITETFWEIFWARFPAESAMNAVYFCPECRSFDLEHP